MMYEITYYKTNHLLDVDVLDALQQAGGAHTVGAAHPQAAPRPVARGVHLALGRHREQRLLATHQLHGPEHADGLALGGDLDLQ